MNDNTAVIDLSTVDSDALTRELGRRIRDIECPAWCRVLHTSQQLASGNYHHDGGATYLTLDPRSITAYQTPTVHVKLALFVPAADDSHECVEQIELQTDDETLLELTVQDAAWLAETLLQACDVVCQSAG